MLTETAKTKIESLFLREKLTMGNDGIYSGIRSDSSPAQSIEREFRESIASKFCDNHLRSVCKYHSIPVMDHEVDRFLSVMPENAIIIDIGGCWGWHWRRLSEIRPDVGIVIVDFVRKNLLNAYRLLGALIGNQVFLLHADATALPLVSDKPETGAFDGVWSVQVFQHIPEYMKAYYEAYRILKKGGRLITYSLHDTPMIKMIYGLTKKRYHREGMIDKRFFLKRADEEQKQKLACIFRGEVLDRFTECLFHPELRLRFSGREGSLFGRIDVYLSGNPRIGRCIARQRSFEVVKH